MKLVIIPHLKAYTASLHKQAWRMCLLIATQS